MEGRKVTVKEFNRRAVPSDARESLWQAADGHAVRRIDWPPPPQTAARRGSLLFMPGRGDAYEKYLESFEHWRLKGWQVTAADWRGQAGSGRLGIDPYTGHVDDFDLWLADLARFWAEWAKQSRGPLVLAGHSMGGHLVLRALAEKLLTPPPAAMVLSAPMLGVHPAWLPLWVQRLLAWAMGRLGDPRRQAWKWSEKPGEFPQGRQRLLTHDSSRYADEVFWREQRPELAMGPGSWGWVASALRSIVALDAPGKLEAVETPVLLVGTSVDRLVDPRAISRAQERLPNAESVIFGSEAAHEILREADPVREKALSAIDEFLDRHALS